MPHDIIYSNAYCYVFENSITMLKKKHCFFIVKYISKKKHFWIFFPFFKNSQDWLWPSFVEFNETVVYISGSQPCFSPISKSTRINTTDDLATSKLLQCSPLNRITYDHQWIDNNNRMIQLIVNCVLWYGLRYKSASYFW